MYDVQADNIPSTTSATSTTVSSASTYVLTLLNASHHAKLKTPFFDEIKLVLAF